MIAHRDLIAANDDEALYILAVDDSASTLALLQNTMRKIRNTSTETCANPLDAIDKCKHFQYDVVIIDYMMPEMNGIRLLSHLRQIENYRSIPIIMLTSKSDREIRIDALSAGVNDFLNKPFDPFEFRARISNMLTLRIAQRQQARLVSYLGDDIEKAMREITLREKEMIWRLALAIDARDGGTGAHVSRVARISYRLALGLGLSEAHSQLIYLGAPLHDVGKIGVPDSILGKPGPLTPEEEKIMRRHVEHGVKILRDGATELLKVAVTIVGGHHERWDGTGYPAGLSGEDIPIEARIVAVADVFDAIGTARPYKAALPFETAFAHIVAGSGTQFDPTCVEVFKQLKGELRKLRVEAI
ncbi:hypothetical protein CCR94_22975 [Rhodoblastus sphagnicola]|uniref:Two-component system response regulator n=1 Tax=Rhodoblastus sphagnicola TaxID=333368 RepID=A0A2S6MV71_9HYPH|nr:HD domain-containing phosphohydrolase [Rhodoblastus sphagnicola]MBB4199728.1 putative two-component system response regulator [Rhodoblastus sphagnicola]PPQ26260.1 hypothetical protein CCR94_22975 [Rhodoblastus sphagnicola]